MMLSVLVAAALQSSSWVAVHTGARPQAYYVYEVEALDAVRAAGGGEVTFYPVFVGGRGPSGGRAVARIRYTVDCAVGVYALRESAQEIGGEFQSFQTPDTTQRRLGDNGDSRILNRLVCTSEALTPVAGGADWSAAVDALLLKNP